MTLTIGSRVGAFHSAMPSSKRAKRLGLESVGVDISKFAVELCRERGYRAELGALDSLPLPDASVDIVTLKQPACCGTPSGGPLRPRS